MRDMKQAGTSDLSFFDRLFLVIEAHDLGHDADEAGARANALRVSAERDLGRELSGDATALHRAVASEAHEGASLLRGLASVAAARVADLVWPDGEPESNGRTLADWLWEPFLEQVGHHWDGLGREEQAKCLEEAEQRIRSGEARRAWISVFAE